MTTEKSGQIIIPTGGGKTYIMIADCDRILSQTTRKSQTIVMVAPRILLANQLSNEFESAISNVQIAHVHSGETHHFSTTKHEELTHWACNNASDKLIFTTYHSLHRVLDSSVNIDRIYFDEAHNGTSKVFFEQVKRVAKYQIPRYFFTATPRISRSKNSISAERGMNNAEIYGEKLEETAAKELIDSGTILYPKVIPFNTDRERTKLNAHEVDCDNLKDIITSLTDKNPKVLVSAPTTRILWNMLTQTDIRSWLYSQQYNIMHITSKHGAVINGKKVGREKFFETLSDWGKDDNKKFVIFHYSILSEGINVPGLTHSVMLRNLPTIEMAQTIGRVIRIGKEEKTYGLICVPVYDRVGITTSRKVEAVVDTIFNQGQPAISTITR